MNLLSDATNLPRGKLKLTLTTPSNHVKTLEFVICPLSRTFSLLFSLLNLSLVASPGVLHRGYSYPIIKLSPRCEILPAGPMGGERGVKINDSNNQSVTSIILRQPGPGSCIREEH